MTDTTAIASDKAPTPETPAAPAATDAAPPAQFAAPAEATQPAESVTADAAATPMEAPKAAEMTAAPEPPKSAEALRVTEPAAAAPNILSAWIGKIQASIVRPIQANRAALVGGGIGFAAGLAILAGTVGFMGVGRLTAAPTPAPAPQHVAADETRILKQSVGKLEGQVASLKASIDSSNRHANAQRTQIANRYEQGARAQNEMQQRLVKIGDAVERLEKRVAAVASAETTGSVAPRYAATAAGVQPPAAVAPEQPEPPIVSGWTIRDVFRGRALVASRRGVFEAAPGLRLPELGRVEAVTRRNGKWVVITEKGIITTMHRPRSANSYDAD